MFNVDIVSSFLVEQGLDTIGWVSINLNELNKSEVYTTIKPEYNIGYKSISSININDYPIPSILSFNIECMSHDFESFPNRYNYEDYISTISIVYHDKFKQCNIAICVKYKDKTNIANHEELDKINFEFIPFVNEEKFKKACNECILFKPNFSKEKIHDFTNKDFQNEDVNTENDQENIKVSPNNILSNPENNENILDKQENNENVLDKQENNNILDKQENNDIKPSITEDKIMNDDNFENITPSNDNNNDDGMNKTISGNMSNREVRYCHLKEILDNNNYVDNSVRNNRYNRLKEILNREKSKSIEQLKIDKNKSENEKNNLLFQNIEEFIKSKEESKNNEKVLKDDIFNNNYDIIYVETEYDLICEFFNQIRKFDPDLIIGYNTFGFDYKYLGQRAGMYLNIDSQWDSDSPFTASRILTKPTKFVRTIDEDVELQIPGRIAIDMFKYAKSLNMASASLNYVSEQLLNKHKIDLPYKDMFYLIYENNEELLNKVAGYCIMDSILTLEIFNVSHQWIQLLEVAKTSRIRIDEIYKNGQSKKFANLLYKYCYDNDICIDEDRSSIQGYKGVKLGVWIRNY